MSQPYYLNVKRALEFTSEAIRHFSNGEELWLAIEGDLTKLPREHIEMVDDHGITQITLASDQPVSMVVVGLSRESSREKFIRSVLPTLGIRSRVFHLRLFVDRDCMMSALDNWDPECTFVDGVSQEWLDDLRNRDIVENYSIRRP